MSWDYLSLIPDLEYTPKVRSDGKCGLEYLLVDDGSPGECSKYSEVQSVKILLLP